MQIVDLISNPQLWDDDVLMSPIIEAFSFSQNPRQWMIGNWDLDKLPTISKTHIDRIHEVIANGYSFSSKHFPQLRTLLKRIFITASQQDSTIIKNLSGVGGYACPNDIVLYFSPQNPSWEESCFYAVIHEANHIMRQAYFSPMKSFLDWMIMEGMAEVFIAEQFPDRALPNWVTSCSDNELRTMMPMLRNFWHKKPYEDIADARDWFFGRADKNIPRWLGYAAGFRLVREFRLQHQEKWDDFIMRSASDFV